MQYANIFILPRNLLLQERSFSVYSQCHLKYTEVLDSTFHLSKGFYKSVTQARSINENGTNKPKGFHRWKTYSAASMTSWIIPFNKKQKQNVAFIIFSSSIHKNHFGTVILVQMQLSPTLSGQRKTFNIKLSLTTSSVRKPWKLARSQDFKS